MFFLVLMFAASLCGIVLSLIVPAYGDILLLAGPVALGALLLILHRALRARQSTVRHILLDGSNVMHWKDETPSFDTLREVIGHLTAQGWTPSVVFDANAGYLLAGNYLDDAAMAQHLKLAEGRVLVVPKGTIADSFLLKVAREYNAPIVTNDKHRDWAETYPEVNRSGYLIKGGYSGETLWIEASSA